jgi:hypothetical protein
MDDSARNSRIVTGKVEAGVEHGSVVLRDGRGQQWQIGRRWSHLTGCTVRLVGHLRPGMMTTAQQGTLLAVDEVEVLEGTPREPQEPGAGRYDI